MCPEASRLYTTMTGLSGRSATTWEPTRISRSLCVRSSGTNSTPGRRRRTRRPLHSQAGSGSRFVSLARAAAAAAASGEEEEEEEEEDQEAADHSNHRRR